jgi:adenylate cyclase
MSVAPLSGRRKVAVRLSTRCAVGLAFAHVLTAAAVAAAVISLSRSEFGEARDLLTEKNLIVASILLVVSSIASAVAGAVNVAPTMRWFVRGDEPTRAQQRAAIRIALRQNAVHFATWIVSAAVFTVVNLDGGAAVAYVTGSILLFGGVATACMGHLMTQQALRPIVAVAMSAASPDVELPGVLSRLVITWTMFSALPTAGIAVLALAGPTEQIVRRLFDVGTSILVVTALSLILGVGATVLVARSISDPVREVVDAMAEIEHGHNTYVAVYDPSEIGRLQSGSNRMVTGLAERERLRDLFGRHVGTDVARRAVEHGASLIGDVREVGVLFVDLVDSTSLASSRPPQVVAELLNEFFRLVVAVVDDHQGLINKFEGDAALAVFGVPLAVDNPASGALATARALTQSLRRLPQIDFGVGVSAGFVFAGNIGAENRYEYTVIGDPVNEAARLAEYAKQRDSRILASGSAIRSADETERQKWTQRGSAVLRGRSVPTDLAEPLAVDSPTSLP